jgi:hypothetical protein
MIMSRPLGHRSWGATRENRIADDRSHETKQAGIDMFQKATAMKK